MYQRLCLITPNQTMYENHTKIVSKSGLSFSYNNKTICQSTAIFHLFVIYPMGHHITGYQRLLIKSHNELFRNKSG